MTDIPLAADAPIASETHTSEPEATPFGVAVFLLTVVVVLAALVYGAFAIGPWVLGVTAVALVPVIFAVLLLITVGK